MMLNQSEWKSYVQNTFNSRAIFNAPWMNCKSMHHPIHIGNDESPKCYICNIFTYLDCLNDDNTDFYNLYKKIN